MKKAAVINFKGGVGKTTLAFHLACYLADHGRVLLIDVDHQSSLSLVILRATLWEQKIAANQTINRVFESFANRRIPMPQFEIIISNPMFERDHRHNWFQTLDLVPAQFELDDTEIDLASTIYGVPALSDWEKRTLLATWLDSIDADVNYDYVIFDCPPATKIVSQNALSCSNCYIIPVIPDELSSRGVSHFQGLVQRKIDEKLDYLRASARVPDEQIPRNYVPSTTMAGIVPFLVKQSGNAASGYTNIHTERLAALRRTWGSAVVDTVGENYIGVPEAVNAGWPVWRFRSRNVGSHVENMMTGICAALKTRIDAS